MGDSTPPGLYRQLLAASWDRLPAAIKRLHSTFAPAEIRGQFNIRRGSGWSARIVGSLFCMPRARDAVDLRLLIRRCDEGEIWIRSFGENTMTTRQAKSPGGILQEWFGILALSFELAAGHEELVYRQVDAAIQLGRMRIRLPAWLCPRVCAVERIAPKQADAVEIRVEVHWPGSRLLLSYDGTIDFANSTL